MQPRFGEAVRRVQEKHGLSVRGMGIRTGIDRFTLTDMRDGAVPRMEIVLRFARGFGLDPNEWLELAGYEAIQDSALSGAQHFARGLALLSQKYERAVPVYLKGGADNLTVEEAERLLAELDRQMREEGPEEEPRLEPDLVLDRVPEREPGEEE